MATLTAERPSSHVSTDPARPSSPPVAPAPAPVRRTRFGSRRQRLLLVVLVVGLVAAGVRATTRARALEDQGTLPEWTSTTVTAPATADAPSAQDTALAQAVEEAKAFVTKTRHLEFLEPVKVTPLEDDAFRERLGVDDAVDDDTRAAALQMQHILVALGLLDPDVDLLSQSNEALGDGVVGLYSYETKELLVRGSATTPFGRSILVHELTHALDDQHFDLGRDLGFDLEEHDAFTALVEGDATRVEHAYVASLPENDRVSIEAATSAVVDTSDDVKPQAAYYWSAFPYLDGPVFVEALAEDGGEEAVDAAFGMPPRTTAEILVPDRYELGISGVRLSAPAIPARPFATGMFGALGLFLLLQSAVTPEEAAMAAVSWEGDLFQAWTKGDQTCVTLRVLLDAPWDAAFTAKLLQRWAERQIDARVEAPGTVLVTSCR